MTAPSRLHPINCFKLTPLARATGFALGLALLPLAASAQSADTPLAISIKAQSLARSLAALAQQARLDLRVQPALVAGKAAPAVSGMLTPSQALDRLLVDSGLVVATEGAALVVQSATPSAEATLPVVRVQASREAFPGDRPAPYAGGQVARGAQLGLLGNRDYMDAPLSIVSITDQGARDLQAKTLFDVLQTDPSIQVHQYARNRSYILRGFLAGTQSVGINGLNGINYYYGRSETAPFERFEIIKGPAGLLKSFVGGGAGGDINNVTKRAADAPLTRLSTEFISEGQLGTAVDLGRRFGTDNEWGVRVNLSHRSGTPQTGGFDRDRITVGSLAVDYRGPRLRASLDAISGRARTEGYSIASNADGIITSPNFKTYPRRSYFHTASESETLIGAFEYDLSDGLQLAASYGRARHHYAEQAASARASGINLNAGTQTVSGLGLRTPVDNSSGNASLRWKLQTGGIQHEITLGLARSHEENRSEFLFTTIIIPLQSAPFFAPRDLSFRPLPRDLPRGNGGRTNSQAIADSLTLLDGRLQVLLGVRRQSVERLGNDGRGGPIDIRSYDKSSTAPAVAALFKVNPQWAIYGNAMENLNFGPTAPNNPAQFVNPGEVFAPTRNKQFEVGSKWDFGSVGFTAALYNITKPSGISVPSGSAVAPLRFAVDGEERNRGLELTAFGEPVRGLRLNAGFAYLQPKFIKTQDGARDGVAVPGLPRRTLTLFGEHDVGAMPGLTVTAGLRAASSFTFEDNVSTPPRLARLPSHSVAELGARYRFKAAGQQVTLRGNVNNVFDKKYYSHYDNDAPALVVGLPRAVSLTAEFEF